MSDWTTPGIPWDAVAINLSSCGPGCPLAEMNAAAAGAWSTDAAWPSSNLAFFQPVIVAFPVVVVGMAWENGSIVSGNVDAGIYDQEGSRLTHTGSTAQAGTSVLQSATCTNIALMPGLYYLALAMDNTTGHMTFSSQLGNQAYRAAGATQMAAAFPLPATATFAAISQDHGDPVTIGQVASVI